MPSEGRLWIGSCSHEAALSRDSPDVTQPGSLTDKVELTTAQEALTLVRPAILTLSGYLDGLAVECDVHTRTINQDKTVSNLFEQFANDLTVVSR